MASMPTAWRVLDRVDAAHLPVVRAARALARERAWVAGAVRIRPQPVAMALAQRQVLSMRRRVCRALWVMRAATWRTR